MTFAGLMASAPKLTPATSIVSTIANSPSAFMHTSLQRSPADNLRGHDDRQLPPRIGAAAQKPAVTIDLNRKYIAFAIGRPGLNFVTEFSKRPTHRLVNSIFDPEQARERTVRIEGRRKVRTREFGRLDRLLQVHPEVDDIQEELQRPLVLLVAAGRAKGEIGLARAQRDRRRQRRARPLARHQSVGVALIEEEGLHPRPQRKAQYVDHRRTRDPAPAGGNRD